MIVTQLTLCVLALLVVRYFWDRRQMYIVSWQMQGPFAWPVIGNAYFFRDIKKIHKTIGTIWEYYGSPVRFWLFQKFIIFLTNPKHLEIVMNNPSTADHGQVSTIIDDIIGLPGLFTSRGEEWKYHRKCLNPTMTLKVINTYYPIFNKWNQRLIKDLEVELDGKTFDIFGYLDKATLHMICDTLFGLEVDLDTKDKFNIMEAVNSLMRTIGLKMYQPYYNVKWIFRISHFYPAYKKCLDGIDKFLNELNNARIREVRETVAEELRIADDPEMVKGKIPKSDNYIRYCMRLVEGGLMTFEEVVAETKTMLAGGFETTANASSYMVLMMAMYPDLQEKLFKEMQSIFPTRDSPVNIDDIPKMEYTERFIKETLRLFPVVPIASRYATEDTDLGDCIIPKGTEVILGIYYMHRAKNIWGDDANEFDPDRFFPDRMAGIHPYAFVPFSAGFHNCIGIRYGNLSLRMLVAWLVRNYRFSTDLRMKDLNFRMDITLKLLNRHMVRIERRDSY